MQDEGIWCAHHYHQVCLMSCSYWAPSVCGGRTCIAQNDADADMSSQVLGPFQTLCVNTAFCKVFAAHFHAVVKPLTSKPQNGASDDRYKDPTDNDDGLQILCRSQPDDHTSPQIETE